MVKKKICNHDFVLYDTIEDLPISQFHRYGKYLLVEGGIGDSIQDIDAKISRVLKLMSIDMKKAQKEVMNLRQAIYMVANEQDLCNKAVLCLVKSVDGKDWTDFSDNGIDELFEMVKDEKIRVMNEIREQITEKIDTELATYFPSIYEDSREKNYTDLLRKRAMLQYAQIVEGKDCKAEIERVNKQLFSNIEPKCFEGADSEEIKFDKDFETMCLALSKEFGVVIRNYSVMQFYTAYETMGKQAQETKKRLNKKK